MTIKIEEGKFYKTRDGRKVGPMYGRTYGGFCDRSQTITHQPWNEGGSFLSSKFPSPLDLVSEWIDTPSPIQEVTVKKEIVQVVETKEKKLVPGRYGYLKIEESYDVFYVSVHTLAAFPKFADKFRETAAALNAIANFLEEQNVDSW